MRFFKFYLLTEDKENATTDVLGNTIYDYKRKLIPQGRFTEWNADDIEVLGRDLTASTRKMVCNRITYKESKKASFVEVEGQRYRIDTVKDLGRWVLFIIRSYRL